MRVGPGCASGKNLWQGMSYISEIRLQAVDDAQENRSWYGEGASGGRIYAYTGNDPLNNVDPLGLWQATISGGLGFGGAITFGLNSGQWNIGAYVGPATGANFAVNLINSAAVSPGVHTNFVGSASVELGPIAADIGASAETTVPQGRISDYGTASATAAANFGPYAAGGQATINPNGSVTASTVVTAGFGTSAYAGWGGTFQSTPTVPSAPQQNLPASSGVSNGQSASASSSGINVQGPGK